MRRFIVLLLLLFCVKSVSAQDGSVAVSPAFNDIVIGPGVTRQTVELTYTNRSTSVVELEIGSVDFKQQDNGVIQFVGQDAGSYSYSLASFLTPEASSLVLNPGEKKIFEVAVQNRQSLSPGGHYAAVVAKLKAAGRIGLGAKVEPSLSALILLRKTGGERFNMSLTASDWPQDTFVFSVPRSVLFTFQNEGNVHLIPYGTAEIKDIFGRVTHKGVLNTSSLRVFPETRRYIGADFNKIAWQLPLSLNSFTVKGNDSLNKVAFTYNASFIYIDPLISGMIVISLIGIWILLRKRKTRRKK